MHTHRRCASLSLLLILSAVASCLAPGRVHSASTKAPGNASHTIKTSHSTASPAQKLPTPWGALPTAHKLAHFDGLTDARAAQRFWRSAPEEWSHGNLLDDGLGQSIEAGPALTFKSTQSYKPPVRSPHSLALVSEVRLNGDFVMEVEAMQTGAETPHRDLCLIFGFEAQDQYFYVHLGAKPDPNSSNVFHVNKADRERLGEVPQQSIGWGRGTWHRLRLECSTVRENRTDKEGQSEQSSLTTRPNHATGRVQVFLDDLDTPLFDQSLPRPATGLIGLGSFDDAGAFRNLGVWALNAEPPHWSHSPFGAEVAVVLRKVESGFYRFIEGNDPFSDACLYAVGHASIANLHAQCVLADADQDGVLGTSGDRWYVQEWTPKMNPNSVPKRVIRVTDLHPWAKAAPPVVLEPLHDTGLVLKPLSTFPIASSSNSAESIGLQLQATPAKYLR